MIKSEAILDMTSTIEKKLKNKYNA